MTQMPSIPSVSKESDDVELGRIFGVLIDHKWWIILITALSAFIGIVYATLSTPIYQGDALVQIERRSTVSPLGDLSNVLGVEDFNTSAEIQILQSRMVLGQAVDRLGRDTLIMPVSLPYIGDYIMRRGIPRPSFMEGQPHIWGGESIEVARFQLAAARRGQVIVVERANDERYRVLINDQPVGIGEIGRVGVFLDGELELRIDAFNAPPGAQFQLFKMHRSSAISSLGSRLLILEAGGRGTSTGVLQLSMTGTDRQEIEDSLNAVVETFLTQNIERQSAQAEQSLAFLEEQAPELRNQLKLAEERLNEYRAKLDSIDVSSEAQTAIQRYIEIEGRLSELEIEEAELAQLFQPSHPNYQALMRQRRHLEKEKAELNARVNELPAAQQEVLRLTRDVEVTQVIYVNVLNKIQELQVAKAGSIGNVRIIDRAQVGYWPIAPNKTRIVILATLIGCMLAVGGVLLRALLRRGVETPEQIEATGVPVYATIPLSDGQSKLVKRVKHRRDRAGKQVISGILASLNPTDTAVEALRSLRTSLHFVMLEAKNNLIMVTGSSPGAGKSFVTINLGVTCAQAGQKVLIIDADMRKGQVHNAFAESSKGGLSELLAGKVEWQEVIRPTKVPGLFYISRGEAPPNPSELLVHESFNRFLDGFSPEYDLVIIDTPPALAVTDAAIVGKRVGTTLIVARFRMNTPREISAALRRLETAGVTVKGCILNAMENKAAVGYGYHHYAYK
ncbi:polysaccharide biosynthesis tyrosine autokinase [Litchfieldella rifensis]|uniref:Polysaccharide biosynthesis tyrosine autokinase n=1 Tax=Litchfieldella rifensis TaxID=762643 RepID=A0ABV7LUA4_9GAMM